MAQEAKWLNKRTFAIGRWDGSLTIFHIPSGAENDPVMSTAFVSPCWGGLEMITPITDFIFATSNDDSSIAVWKSLSPIHNKIVAQPTLFYNGSYGVANSGTVVEAGGESFFVSGHEEGYLLIWSMEKSGDAFSLCNIVNIRSKIPVGALWNIRSIVTWKDGIVITGSEDGDICAVSVPDGEVLTRTKYNPSARRGINYLDLHEDYLLLANCAVGKEDKNTWLYQINADNSLTLLDSINLKVNQNSDQVFNFRVELAFEDRALYFFAATGEGALWVGKIENSKLHPIGNYKVSMNQGAALSYQSASKILAVVGDDIHLLQLEPSVVTPERS
jgi:WD40 repeat protein